MTATATASYAVDIAWVEQLVAESTKLRATKYEFYTLAGQLWVQVAGAQWAAHAWQVAVGGRIMPSYVDVRGVRRQQVWASRVCVEVIDDPSKRGT